MKPHIKKPPQLVYDVVKIDIDDVVQRYRQLISGKSVVMKARSMGKRTAQLHYGTFETIMKTNLESAKEAIKHPAPKSVPKTDNLSAAKKAINTNVGVFSSHSTAMPIMYNPYKQQAASQTMKTIVEQARKAGVSVAYIKEVQRIAAEEAAKKAQSQTSQQPFFQNLPRGGSDYNF